MTTLAEIDDAVAGLLADVAGLPRPAAGERDAANGVGFLLPSPDEQAKIEHAWISVVSLGRDELRSEYDADAVVVGDTFAGTDAPLGGVVYSIAGQRVYTMQVKVECARADLGARAILQRALTRLRLPSSLTRLRAVGLALNTIRPILDVSFTSDMRSVTAYVAEVVLNGKEVETDAPVTTIETWTVTPTVTQD